MDNRGHVTDGDSVVQFHPHFPLTDSSNFSLTKSFRYLYIIRTGCSNFDTFKHVKLFMHYPKNYYIIVSNYWYNCTIFPARKLISSNYFYLNRRVCSKNGIDLFEILNKK